MNNIGWWVLLCLLASPWMVPLMGKEASDENTGGGWGQPLPHIMNSQLAPLIWSVWGKVYRCHFCSLSWGIFITFKHNKVFNVFLLSVVWDRYSSLIILTLDSHNCILCIFIQINLRGIPYPHSTKGVEIGFLLLVIRTITLKGSLDQDTTGLDSRPVNMFAHAKLWIKLLI